MDVKAWYLRKGRSRYRSQGPARCTCDLCVPSTFFSLLPSSIFSWGPCPACILCLHYLVCVYIPNVSFFFCYFIIYFCSSSVFFSSSFLEGTKESVFWYHKLTAVPKKMKTLIPSLGQEN